MFGSKYLRMLAEQVIGSERDVTGHLWSDFTWRMVPKRYRDLYPARSIALRGKGVGVLEPPAKQPLTKEDTDERQAPDHNEALDILRASFKDDPDITLRQREAQTGISKSRLQRLMKTIKAEGAES